LYYITVKLPNSKANVAAGQTIPLSQNYSKRNNDIPRSNKTVKKFKTKNKQGNVFNAILVTLEKQTD